jgi:hypothetical protein
VDGRRGALAYDELARLFAQPHPAERHGSQRIFTFRRLHDGSARVLVRQEDLLGCQDRINRRACTGELIKKISLGPDFTNWNLNKLRPEGEPDVTEARRASLVATSCTPSAFVPFRSE